MDRALAAAIRADARAPDLAALRAFFPAQTPPGATAPPASGEPTAWAAWWAASRGTLRATGGRYIW